MAEEPATGTAGARAASPVAKAVAWLVGIVLVGALGWYMWFLYQREFVQPELAKREAGRKMIEGQRRQFENRPATTPPPMPGRPRTGN